MRFCLFVLQPLRCIVKNAPPQRWVASDDGNDVELKEAPCSDRQTFLLFKLILQMKLLTRLLGFLQGSLGKYGLYSMKQNYFEKMQLSSRELLFIKIRKP